VKPYRRSLSIAVPAHRLGLLFAFIVSYASASFAATVVANDLGAKGDGTTLNTSFIQKALDQAEVSHGIVTFKPGLYLTGSLFIKSGTTLDVPQGVTLIGSQHLEDYPMLPTRIAGIEMSWPAALVNARDVHNVSITGKGTIDGDGPIWWKSYWDLRKIYEPKGLRWASDYDARRPRLMLLQNASDVHVGGGLLLKRSGFWTIQVLYSHDITIDGVIIRITKAARAHRPTASISTLPAGSSSRTQTLTSMTTLSVSRPVETPTVSALIGLRKMSSFAIPSSGAAPQPSPSEARPRAASGTSKPTTSPHSVVCPPVSCSSPRTPAADLRQISASMT